MFKFFEGGVIARHEYSYFFFCFCFLTLFSGAVHGSTSSSTSSGVNTPQIQTIPLVPHHVQQQRRRRDLLSEEAGLPGDADRPTHAEYPTSVRRRDVAQQVGALYQGYGTHYVDLWCGSPPQRQTVIVDTGSGITAFPCSQCRDCGAPKYHVDNLFDESASSTFQHNTCSGSSGCVASRSECKGSNCRISMSYAEGSRWDAVEAVDNCYIGGPHESAIQRGNDGGGDMDSYIDDLDPRHVLAFDLVFGCQTLVTGLFKTQLADGIMGMDARTEAFWYQMFRAGKMDEKKFSLCFSRPPTSERKGTEAGALTMGGIDARFHTSPLVHTPNSSGGRAGFFSVKVRRIWLRDGTAGESAKSALPNPSQGTTALEVSTEKINTGGVIVDSGTTDTYWNRAISNAFKEVFKKKTGMVYGNGAMSLTHDELLALPTILFQLESNEEANPQVDPYKTVGLAGSLDSANPYDVIVAFPPTHYMEYDADTKKYTSRFYVTEHRGSVLGANVMMGHNVLFDSATSRIGWAESDCDYTSLVTANGYDFTITGSLQTPVPAPASHPTSDTSPSMLPNKDKVPSPTESATATSIAKENFMTFVDRCDTSSCQVLALFGIAVVTCVGACICYVMLGCCCPCVYRTTSTDYNNKNTFAGIGSGISDGLELVGFQDEPLDDDDDEDDDDEDEQSSEEETDSDESEGEDENSSPPEFQGDFI